MNAECCGNCRFWIAPPAWRQQFVDYEYPTVIEPTPGSGIPRYKTIPGTERCECRRYPPFMSKNPNTTDNSCAWPQTRAEDWCREWETKEPRFYVREHPLGEDVP